MLRTSLKCSNSLKLLRPTKITFSSHEVYKSWNLGCLWRLLSDFCWEMTDCHSSWHVAARTSFGSEMERLGWHFETVEAKKWCSCRSGQSVLCAGDSGLWKICGHNVSILELQKTASLILRHCYYFYGIFSACHLGALRLDLQERHRVQKVMGHVACCSYETHSGPSIRYLSVNISVLFSTWKTVCLRSAEVPWWFQFGSIDLHQRSGSLILCFFFVKQIEFPWNFTIYFLFISTLYTFTTHPRHGIHLSCGFERRRHQLPTLNLTPENVGSHLLKQCRYSLCKKMPNLQKSTHKAQCF